MSRTWPSWNSLSANSVSSLSLSSTATRADALEVEARADLLGRSGRRRCCTSTRLGSRTVSKLGMVDSARIGEILRCGDNSPMHRRAQASACSRYNTFGLAARSRSTLVRVRSDADVRRVRRRPELGRAPKFILGGGSNIVLTRDVPPLVLKVEVQGRRLVEERADAWIVEAGAGENWHDFVAWTLDAGLPGPGEPGADPGHGRRRAGAEHRRLRRRAAGPLRVARRGRPGHRPQRHARCRACAPSATATACSSTALAGRSVITRVRFRLPRPWKPVLGYLDLERKMRETGIAQPDARQIFDWVCAIRRAKLPDPARDRQRRQLLQEPGGHARAVPRHHRPRPGDRALPDARRQRQAGRRLDDRRLRLEGQVGRRAPASTRSRRWCWSTAAARAAPR